MTENKEDKKKGSKLGYNLDDLIPREYRKNPSSMSRECYNIIRSAFIMSGYASGDTKLEKLCQLPHFEMTTLSVLPLPPYEDVSLLMRPARRQLDASTISRVSYTQGHEDYNIWYGKYSTDRNEFGSIKRDPAPYSCDPYADVGYSKANDNSSYFCIFFAKGCCVYGSDCHYLHRIPTLRDESRLPASHDCFGRERCATHRDDMDGVGSFLSPCTTLYISNLEWQKHSDVDFQDLSELIIENFSKWGKLLEAKVVSKKSMAYVQYSSRVSAEFAKVAMDAQKMGRDDLILCVRWAQESDQEENRYMENMISIYDLDPWHNEVDRLSASNDEEFEDDWITRINTEGTGLLHGKIIEDYNIDKNTLSGYSIAARTGIARKEVSENKTSATHIDKLNEERVRVANELRMENILSRNLND